MYFYSTKQLVIDNFEIIELHSQKEKLKTETHSKNVFSNDQAKQMLKYRKT